MSRNWQRYAKALDMRLEGKQYGEIATHFGVTRQRAEQMVKLARAQLAYRVFKGLRRPRFYTPWQSREWRDKEE